MFPVNAGASERLAPRFDRWLNRDVVYIITDEEKKAFRELKTDQERDEFIQHFWELRNPTPGAPSNPYKDEHYRRLDYANQYFGVPMVGDGWRTDRGHVYIVLGEPQQRAHYPATAHVRPMEIWFYQNTNPALPPYFYVVFYKPQDTGEYKLYSPYMDGPDKLVTTLEAHNDRLQSLKMIERALGHEVARTTLSLIPDEPVSLEDAVSSLQSDVLLSTIKSLANNPLSKESLNNRRMLEQVTHSIVLGDQGLELLTVPLRNSAGYFDLNYMLRLSRADELTLARQNDQYYYSLELGITVNSAQGKLIYSENKNFSNYLSEADYEQNKDKRFSIEGWLPLSSGRYDVQFELSNKLAHTAYRVSREIVIPELPPKTLSLSEPFAFSDVENLSTEHSPVPFSAPGLRFTPLGNQGLVLHAGEDLKISYQLWAPAVDPRSLSGKTLQVDYVYGRLGLAESPETIEDMIDRGQFDSEGTLWTGKKIETHSLDPGNYRLVVTVTDPESGRKAYASLAFRILASANQEKFWTVYDDQEGAAGMAEYYRGLCYLAAGDAQSAAQWFQRALEKDPGNELARTKVVERLFAGQDFSQVASLFSRRGISARTNELTILQAAESMDRLGNTVNAIDLLESAVQVKGPSSSLFLSLANYYQRIGDSAKASELRQKSQALSHPSS